MDEDTSAALTGAMRVDEQQIPEFIDAGATSSASTAGRWGGCRRGKGESMHSYGLDEFIADCRTVDGEITADHGIRLKRGGVILLKEKSISSFAPNPDHIHMTGVPDARAMAAT
jgi:hypothetical protein